MRGMSSPSPLPRLLGGWGAPVLMFVIALVVAVPAAALSGATMPVVLGDAGAIVRWGLPLVGVLHDLAAALTIGLLFVAAFLVPEGPTSDRRRTAARAAIGSAAVWLVTVVVGWYLSFGELAGVPPNTPGYLGDLWAATWQLEFTRLMAIEAIAVAVLLPLAAWARTKTALAWAAVLALASLTPAAYAGHSAGTVGHETAVTALGLHLVGLSVWVGGLLAIGLLLPILGPALAITVQRFSTVAGWAFAMVAVSGVLFATVTIGSPTRLGTSYGIIVLLKVGLLLLLGVAGYLQRRVIVARGVDSPRRFAWLASGELVLMSLAVGLGVVLTRTPPPQSIPKDRDIALSLTGFPMPQPWDWGRMLTAWRVDWLFAFAALAAVGLYAWGVWRLRRRGDSWPWWRLLVWVLGWGLLVYVTSGGPGVYGKVMFSIHMVEHIALMMAVPILLVPAQPITLALRALTKRRDKTLGPRELLLAVVHSRWATFFVNPIVAGTMFFASLVAFYWSGLLDWALTTHTGHVAMVVHFSITGYAFVWALIGRDPGPPKWQAPFRMLVLIATLAAHAFFGLALMQGAWLLAPEFYKTLAVPWVPDLLVDQQLGGAIAWGIGEAPTLVLMMLVAVDWMQRDSRESIRYDRKAARDDEAELRAYNARLQQLATHDRRST